MTFDMTVMMICSSKNEFGYWLYWHCYRLFIVSMYYRSFCMFLLLMSQCAYVILK